MNSKTSKSYIWKQELGSKMTRYLDFLADHPLAQKGEVVIGHRCLRSRANFSRNEADFAINYWESRGLVKADAQLSPGKGSVYRFDIIAVRLHLGLKAELADDRSVSHYQNTPSKLPQIASS